MLRILCPQWPVLSVPLNIHRLCTFPLPTVGKALSRFPLTVHVIVSKKSFFLFPLPPPFQTRSLLKIRCRGKLLEERKHTFSWLLFKDFKYL